MAPRLVPSRRTAVAAIALGLGVTVNVAGHAQAATTPKTYDAIVALDNCSGSVVRFPGASDGDKAVVMTNGHCLTPDMPDPETYHLDEATDRTVTVLGGEDAHKVTTLDLDRIIYSTMTGTDVTLYRSTSTYAQLARLGVTARTMSTTHPADGTAIDVPSGYWKQHYSCSINGFVHQLKEDGYTWNDSIRYGEGCTTPHGSSGSPVINPSTGEVIGINNTGNDDGEECTLNNPCEVDENGKVTVTKGQSYAEETYQIAACWDSGRIDLTKSGCTLYGADPSSDDPTPPSTGGDNAVVNPGFEQGSTGWTGSNGPITTDSGEAAHSGSAKLWLGGNGHRATEYEQQQVTVPANGRLTYWEHVDTDEDTTSARYDTFAVQVVSGGQTKTVDALSNLDAKKGYTQRTVDLSAYAGKTVTLKLTASEDDYAQTSFVVDDLALTGR